MPIRKHDFTNEIITILDRNTNGQGEEIIKSSEMIQYLNILKKLFFKVVLSLMWKQKNRTLHYKKTLIPILLMILKLVKSSIAL